MAKFIMIQGTSSNVGKSIIVAGLCRIFKNKGYKVAPFKAQNMALNSGVTSDGFEMGRAQIFQAEAAGIAPRVEMNPILLKPTTDVGAQVIVMGRVERNMFADEYQKNKKRFIRIVLDALFSLSKDYEVIVIEGAGSPSEINLKKYDIVNMGLAKLINSPVLLVGDIDRGGVFASLFGTISLLEKNERNLVKGFLINKFRGDKNLLYDGLEKIEKIGKIPVLGVIPFIRDLIVDDEDSVSLFEEGKEKVGGFKIKVIKLPRISNFTDFHPFLATDEVSLEYVDDPLKLMDASLVFIPGTKNTIADLRFLKEEGFDLAIRLISKRGIPVFGICGGYQMMGKVIEDPFCVEGGGVEEGLSLIDAKTFLSEDKTVASVSGFSLFPERLPIKGYEIHMGVTKVYKYSPLFEIKERNGVFLNEFDGFFDRDRMVFGTYIHGLFDSDSFRTSFLNFLSKNTVKSLNYSKLRDEMFERIAKVIEENVDMRKIFEIVGLPGR